MWSAHSTPKGVPYHLVAMRDGIAPKQALARMRNYILLCRGETPEEIDSEGAFSTSAPVDEIPI